MAHRDVEKALKEVYGFKRGEDGMWTELIPAGTYRMTIQGVIRMIAIAENGDCTFADE